MEAATKQISLYDFPKDILVKMISSIETDMKKELETKSVVLNQVVKLAKISGGKNIEYHICSYTENSQYKICDNYVVSCGYISSQNLNKIRILPCTICFQDFCEKHLVLTCNDRSELIWTCDNCYKQK
jgi:hypothetical protein